MPPKKRLSSKSPQQPSKPPSSTIPSPFTPVPSALQPLLSALPKSQIYITHIDSHPATHKRNIFAVPVLLNLSIIALLLWRIYVQTPWYGSLLLSFVGEANETTIYFLQEKKSTLLWKIFRRGCTFMVDWLLIRVVGPWPWSFFLEGVEGGSGCGNPVYWRWKVGVRDHEVVVRRSRGWGGADLVGESSGKKGEESPFFKTRLLPAIEGRRLREKTGYVLMDKDWDLDFGAMIMATAMLDQGSLSMDDLRTSVFVYIGNPETATGQWCYWPVWKLDADSSAKETQARQKIILFKDRLTAMGKENLFFKWVELVQFESSAEGGWTRERQEETAEKAKRLFEDQGVDFDAFLNELGGLEGLPGWE